MGTALKVHISSHNFWDLAKIVIMCSPSILGVNYFANVHTWVIVYIPSYHQCPQEGSHCLVTIINGESRLDPYPMQQVMFALIYISHGHCSAGLYCIFRHREQWAEVYARPSQSGIWVTPADFAAPRPVGIIHHLPTAVYFIYQVMWFLRKVHTLFRKWLYLAFHWLYSQFIAFFSFGNKQKNHTINNCMYVKYKIYVIYLHYICNDHYQDNLNQLGYVWAV